MAAPLNALIVAHGQPSDPAPAAAELAALAARVAAHLPGWHVGAATLAEPEALARAIAAAGPGIRVYPLFMAGGWFTKTHLPQRLAQAGAADWQVLEPFGTDPAIQALCMTIASEAAKAAGQSRAATDILLAAHGSSRSAAPAEVAFAMAGRLHSEAGFGKVAAGFIDQSPRIAALTGFGPTAFCLPFFAAKGGHVTDDLPKALAEARFQGRVLPPLGLDRRVPGLIAAALRHGQGA